MKKSKYPIASIACLIVMAANLTIKYLMPYRYTTLKPVLDGILLGVVIVFLLYYVRIYVGAWLNNRREAANEQES